ncbi:MAG: hypothetical protein AAGU12_15480, partial [Clostridiales bacterium]
FLSTVQFSRIGPSFSRRLLHISKSLPRCQHLFLSFFGPFFQPFSPTREGVLFGALKILTRLFCSSHLRPISSDSGLDSVGIFLACLGLIKKFFVTGLGFHPEIPASAYFDVSWRFAPSWGGGFLYYHPSSPFATTFFAFFEFFIGLLSIKVNSIPIILQRRTLV